MFSSSTSFRSIPCPVEDECGAPNCIFKHRLTPSQRAWQRIPELDELDSLPPRKRSKLEHSPAVSPSQPKPSKAFVGTLLSKNASGNANKLDSAGSVSTTARDISPPPIPRRPTQSKPARPSQQKPETLNPRMLVAPPAGHATRVLYLSKLHEAMVAVNERLLKDGTPKQRQSHMTPEQLIKLALDEEERMARENPSVYANVIKMSMVAHKKMSLEEWILKQQKTSILATEKQNPYSHVSPSITGLSTIQELQVLPCLLAKQDGLEKFGYVTSVPSEEGVNAARAALASCDYWEKCERCDSRFQVFPDRRQDGALTSGGECRHHPLRPVIPPKDPATKGPSGKVYPCCNEPIGTSQGCETMQSHVFKIADKNRLACVMQYEETPENPAALANRAVSFDCEMGWTTAGLELIRLTAVSWPKGDLLIDVLVKPLGTVLDLNSRFSGVRPEQFADALPYQESKSLETKNAQQLEIVESPRVARQLLFKLIGPTTPLIGHAIENDLNAVRVVHPCIIDTVLLYPVRGGLPLRKSLKAAANEFLGRSIQGGGAAGHDSKEDAKATGDLVLLKVKHKWTSLLGKGWKVAQGGKLIQPPSQGLEGTFPRTTLCIEESCRRKTAALGKDAAKIVQSEGAVLEAEILSCKGLAAERFRAALDSRRSGPSTHAPDIKDGKQRLGVKDAASNFLSPPSLPWRKPKQPLARSPPPPVVHYRLNNITATADPLKNRETFLILTPLARFYPGYFDNLLKLTYPHDLISVGFIIPKDSTGNTAARQLQERIKKIQALPEGQRFASITILRQDFEPPLSSQLEADRHKMDRQRDRRAAMAKARNALLFTTLGPTTSWVLWLDSDIVETPPTLIQDLARHDRPIIVPNCYQRFRNPDTGKSDIRPYDFNSWVDSEQAQALAKNMGADDILLEGYAEMATYRTLMAHLYDGLTEPDPDAHKEIFLDGVGGTALLVKADVHRDGAMFPPFAFYHLIETEGFAKMAARLGWKSFGLPNYLVRWNCPRTTRCVAYYLLKAHCILQAWRSCTRWDEGWMIHAGRPRESSETGERAEAQMYVGM
ncbi:hypothetical protein FH972_025673 [Carpinus fangiana]|uniref:Exonuclease domain-containing protein n=1 Tax=Carpinus fangiana TaxID=176857 RepID=A0A5N6L2A8_9ROSI|nr:hypothetical protein FH972_025673 [Carpinus fangiana]